MSQYTSHEAVLREEAVSALSVRAGATYIDATFGRGGHSRAILAALGADGRLLSIDRDPEAVAAARALQQEYPQLEVLHSSFAHLQSLAEQAGVTGKVAGILFDLGVSSPQLDNPGRGFSFSHDGPLDMRMDPARGTTAADWIGTASATDIANVLYEFGEERHSRRIARRIVEERQLAPIESTGRLAEIVKQANPAWEKDKHPATRSFQAIRLYINSELEELRAALKQSLTVLAVGGRLVVISFHSLEDRIVKKFIAVQTKGDNFPRDLPVPESMLQPTLRTLGKAVRPTVAEVNANPRARSAIMRVAEKIA